MRKKYYALENVTLSIVTPPNETYDGREISVVVSTTAGVFIQFEKKIKILKAKEETKSKKS